jgi:hypothetical protein
MFKTKNATCYHIFEHRAMLSVGASKEEGQHYITFVKMRECSQQMFKRKNAARCPPINAPGSIFGAFCLSFGCHFEPNGGGQRNDVRRCFKKKNATVHLKMEKTRHNITFLNIGECWQQMLKGKTKVIENAYFHGGGSGNRPTHHRPDRHISRPTAIKVCIFHDFVAVQLMVDREIVRPTVS